ncbi:MAG TPA: RpoL/Rpb11 RNA polymerase subunit family protein [Candidatus Thermoplasmatota archaeon]|nr:RpoL/Rpb11 RNA polymerase subunit family protein [Candidatus Thermoplasmatota archaeon]
MMDLRLVSKTDKKMELEFIGENDTLLNLLKQRLLEDPGVESATYIMGHPYLDNPLFVFEMRSGKADAAIKNAAKDLRQHFDEFETLLVRATGA